MRALALRTTSPFRCSSLAAAAAVVAAAASLTLAPGAGKAAVTWGGLQSGLPWASGGNGDLATLESLRGRRLDVRTGYLPKSNWRDMIRSAPAVRYLGARGAKPVVAFGMLTNQTRGQLSQCAGGQFDTYIRQIGQAMVNAGQPGSILRIGWEGNRVNGFPWAVTGDGTSWKGCFRRWVSVLRSVPGQRFVTVWNMGQKGTFRENIDRMYPGNDAVDVVGTQFYDRCTAIRSQAEWNQRLNKKSRNGSPLGIGAWLAYAKSKGKRLAIPEWGISGPRYLCPDAGFDNPLFIQLFNGWLRQNAGSIAFEAYFNGHGIPNPRGGSHKIAPTTWNPRAAAAYRSLW